jgi:hypothetical protein
VSEVNGPHEEWAETHGPLRKWRNIAVALIDPRTGVGQFSKRVIADFVNYVPRGLPRRFIRLSLKARMISSESPLGGLNERRVD